MILEALAQAAGILAFKTAGVVPDDKSRFYFVGIDGARFRRPVVPGDQLALKATFDRAMRGIWKFTTVAEVDGRGSRFGDDDGRAGGQALIDPRAIVVARRRDRRGRRDRPVRRHRRGRHGSAPAAGSARMPSSMARPRSAADNKVFQFASIGDAPQDKKYAGEPTQLDRRRPQRVPRVLLDQPRHGRRPRRHDDRATTACSWRIRTSRTTASSAATASCRTALPWRATSSSATGSSSRAIAASTSSARSARTPSSRTMPR